MHLSTLVDHALTTRPSLDILASEIAAPETAVFVGKSDVMETSGSRYT